MLPLSEPPPLVAALAGGEGRGLSVCASLSFFFFFSLEDLPRNPTSSKIFTKVKPAGELLIRLY